MEYVFREATLDDVQSIWLVLKDAIQRRKMDGSNQWQDGYPNPDVIQNDITQNAGYVLTDIEQIVGYCAILINDEPAYAGIDGKWLSTGDFIVFHRVAIHQNHLGKGIAKLLFKHIEAFAIKNNIKSIKADTNFDNSAMLHLFEKMGYAYCGEVYFRGSVRKAYEKLLD